MKNLIIGGPTASGKSGIAFKLAQTLGNVELISADAFQVYKGLDVGTAKASLEERQAVLHHLVDIIEPSECYTAGLFSNHAEELIGDIRSRGKVPVIVGGTGLYIKTLTDGIFDCPAIDPSVRESLQEELEKDGLHSLFSRLEEKDPEYASRISCNDPVRTVRALEVITALNISFTEAHKKYLKPPLYEYEVCVLSPDRGLLYGDINRRTDAMWKAGWVEEVRTLLDQGVSEDCPAFRAIGYGEAVDFVKNGGNETNIIAEIAKQTRHFAKRQFTWFKGMDGVKFYNDKNKLFDDAVALCQDRGEE